jgi:hypothetical protein
VAPRSIGGAGAAIMALALVVAGCSSSEGSDDAADASTSLEAPAFGGSFECIDEAGDQLDGRSDAETPAPDPRPGMDLTEAEVVVIDDELVVSFTTDEPAVVEDQPRFVVAKGLQVDPATWFEVRVYAADRAWVVERRRLPTQLNAAGVAQEQVDVLGLPVDVVDSTVSVAIPLDQLPAIDGTATWQFGSASADGAVIDDCNELTD